MEPYIHCLRNINAGCVIAPDGFEADDAIEAVINELNDPETVKHKTAEAEKNGRAESVEGAAERDRVRC